jgi:hypothetical protein
VVVVVQAAVVVAVAVTAVVLVTVGWAWLLVRLRVSMPDEVLSRASHTKVTSSSFPRLTVRISDRSTSVSSPEISPKQRDSSHQPDGSLSPSSVRHRNRNRKRQRMVMVGMVMVMVIRPGRTEPICEWRRATLSRRLSRITWVIRKEVGSGRS